MNKLKNLSGLALLFLVMTTSCNYAKDHNTDTDTDPIDETYVEADADSPCLADPAWFQIDPSSGMRNTPAPAEDSTSVFGDNVNVSNCDFHQWSWQKFLWLTNDVSGRPLFIENLIQVNSHTVPVPTTNNQIVLSSTDNVQATGDILNTNKSFNSNDSSYTVYYSIHVDSSLYNSIQLYAPMDKSEYTDATFPVGALELKVAWVNADAVDNSTDYFIIDAVVEGVNTNIALLGMHVVGIVYNHPEFVWATFEHKDLVPYYDWTATTTSDVPVTSATNKLLFNSNATGTIADITSNGSNDSTNVFAVNQYGVPRQPGNVYLATSQDGAESFNNIDSINADVDAQLIDIWGNYFYNGSIWINTETYSYPTQQARLLITLADSLHDASPGKLPRGSVAMYNITMETYEQLGFSPTTIHGQNVVGMGNCFSCHSATGGSSLTISHIFNGAVDNANGQTPAHTKQKHLNEINEFIKKMK